jgi:hypothetical protein
VPPEQPNAATINVHEALRLLDARFADFAEGVNKGEYAFWLGSGISRSRVLGLDGVLRKMIEFLRTRIAAGDANCAFRIALDDVFKHATLSEDEQVKMAQLIDDFARVFPEFEIVPRARSEIVPKKRLALIAGTNETT